MPIQKGNYAFQLVQSEDWNLLQGWLNEPEVARWYKGPGTVEDLERKLGDERIRMQLVLLDDTPIAFVQDYDIHGWDDHHLSHLPSGSRGVDTFIGVGTMMGRGHGTRFLSLLARELFASGVPALGIDPHPDNSQALRAYRKVGFVEKGECDTHWGRVVLMCLHASSG